MTCDKCGERMRYESTTAAGIDIYVCPACGKVEFAGDSRNGTPD